MITKVFESFTVSKKILLKKIISEPKEEIYFETISRTERVYQPPTEVTHCLRPSCGNALYDSMWIGRAGKSGKFLCKSCWYSISESEREKYRKKAQELSQGGSSYRIITDRIKKTRTVSIDREIEIEDTIEEKGFRLVYPKEITFNQSSKLLKDSINLTTFLSEHTHTLNDQFITEAKLQEDRSWFNTSSLEKALFTIRQFKKKHEMEKIKIFRLAGIEAKQTIIDEKQVLEEFNDIVGFYPNVPAYIQGHPLNMYNNRRTNILTIDNVLDIYVNLALDSRADFGHYRNRGVIIYSLIDYLLNVQQNIEYKINLHLLDASYIEGEAIILEFSPILLKRKPKFLSYNDEAYQDENHKFSQIYNTLTSLPFYRLLMINYKSKFIQKEKLRETWQKGYGYCMSNESIKKVLNLDNSTLLIGSPFEHKINGYFMDDDYLNTMDSLGIETEVEDNQNDIEESEVKEHNAREIIKKRQITSIIHVTSSDNIESIKKHGLLSKKTLDDKKINYHFNDPLRLDLHTDAICLSVQEQNDYLFGEFEKRNPITQYKIIELDPSFLYELKNKEGLIKRIYSDYNAASRFSKKSEFDMEIIFKDRLRRKGKIHIRNDKKSSEPTSAQAEILFFSDIPPTYILGIYDYKKEKKESEESDRKSISQICREQGLKNSLSTQELLLTLGYIKVEKVHGKTIKVPTTQGEKIGISRETTNKHNESFEVNLFNSNAESVLISIMKEAKII
jgi:hypothetical protein